MNASPRAMAAAVLSNFLFACLFFYSPAMSPLHGTDVFAWRMAAAFPAACLLLSFGGGWRDVREFIRRQGGKLRRWAMILLPSPILAGQMWLFMWAPVNGKGMDVAIGYFLFPLAHALGGVIFFGERLNRAQQSAIALAGGGVLLEIVRTGAFSWASIIVFVTFPIYYLLRRGQNVPPLIGLFLDMALAFPFVLTYLFLFSDNPAKLGAHPLLLLPIMLLGVHSIVSQQLNLYANNRLPVVLFGILSYLEPALLFLIALFFLGEPLHGATFISYAFIWAGIAVVIVHNLKLFFHPSAFKETI